MKVSVGQKDQFVSPPLNVCGTESFQHPLGDQTALSPDTQAGYRKLCDPRKFRPTVISFALLMISFQPAQLRISLWPLVLLPFVMVGCADQNHIRPQLTTPPLPAFSESGTGTPPERWWSEFGNPDLSLQIDRALRGNYTLAVARQRVTAARALARREASDLFGDLDGVVGFSSTFGPERDRSSLQLGLDANYPVDLWGEIQSRVDAERLRATATGFDYEATGLALTAEIARTWFSLIEGRAQVVLLDDQIDTNRTGLEIQESRFGLGLIRSADVLRQRQLLESTLEQSVVARASIEVLEHQLAVLLGEMPQTASYETGVDLPKLPPLPATGLPSDLLQRRPDVRRDYIAFQAADQDLAAAISAQYPRVNLTGSLLNVADSPETVFRDWFVSIGAQLVAPLLDGGQRKAEVDRRSALVCQRFYEYAQTMLIAFAQVEDSLVQERYQLERIERLRKQVELAGQSSDQLRQQYLIGEAEYLDVLSAITAQQRLQRQILSAQLELVLIRISLYVALAGDFDGQTQLNAQEPFLIQNEFQNSSATLELVELPALGAPVSNLNQMSEDTSSSEVER